MVRILCFVFHFTCLYKHKLRLKAKSENRSVDFKLLTICLCIEKDAKPLQLVMLVMNLKIKFRDGKERRNHTNIVGLRLSVISS